MCILQLTINMSLNCLGQVLTRENVEDVIKFAYKEKLFLLADEVIIMLVCFKLGCNWSILVSLNIKYTVMCFSF